MGRRYGAELCYTPMLHSRLFSENPQYRSLQFQGHHLKINSISFNEDSSVLASGSDDKTVRLWDMRARESRYPIQILEDAKDSIGSVCIKGATIAVGSVDGNVRIYDIRKGSMAADNLNGISQNYR